VRAHDSDMRGIWAERLTVRRHRAAAVLDGLYARSLAVFWGVEIGEECVFYGRPIFRRLPEGSILIGERCVFRSARWSNQIGINRPCMITTVRRGARLRIGSDCGFSGAVVAAATEIQIGNHVLVGANVTITDSDWHGLQPDARDEAGDSEAVHICDRVWLGLNVVVLKGVTIGKDSVIAAGSVVSASIPEGVIAAGQPARVLREL